MVDDITIGSLEDSWWYYTVEHSAGKFYKGIYPDDMVLLPRLNLSKIDVRGMETLDICTMEGLIPTIMSKSGARRVVACDTARPSSIIEEGEDTIDLNRRKMAVIKSLHNVDFDYEVIPERVPVAEHMASVGAGQFDVINLSGLLYHVFSPMHWIGSVRPLVRDGGLAIISTNVSLDDDHTMKFNVAGSLQPNLTTYWYLSIPLFDYMLRYFRLRPIRCEFSHTQEGGGYMSVICRAEANVVADPGDTWMAESAWHSWDSKWWGGLTNAGPRSTVALKSGDEKPDERLDLWQFYHDSVAQPFFGSDPHTAVLRLNDTE